MMRTSHHFVLRTACVLGFILAISLLIPQAEGAKKRPKRPSRPAPSPSECLSKNTILDEQGRHLIPGGFVVITEDATGPVFYSADDYHRMVRMGANFQVIRLAMGKLGGWPGMEPQPEYLEQIDTMVRLGKEAGLKTIFKMATYDIQGFRKTGWDELWRNENHNQDAVAKAWRMLQKRYCDEPSVFGYDLLNEPSRRLNVSYEQCQKEDLIPFLRRLIDELHEVSPEKWALYQPLHIVFADFKPGTNPHTKMMIPMNRKRIIFAPHLYTKHIDKVASILNEYQHAANLSNAPLMIPEWGIGTPFSADSNLEEQYEFTKLYQKQVEEFDKRGLGAVKAWFCGSRNRLRMGKDKKIDFTWAIFSDKSPTGQVERKYITDVMVRPRPLVVAGRLHKYGMDFATRKFTMVVTTDPKLGATEIFIPAGRHYPDGFRVKIGDDLLLNCSYRDNTLTPIMAKGPEARRQAKLIHWNPDHLHLVIDRWMGPPKSLAVVVIPGRVDKK